MYNGFPLVFSDTGVYVSAAVDRYLPRDRSVWYSVLATMFDLRLSPWLSIFVQSLITSWVIWRLVPAIFGIISPFRLILLALLLTVVTGLPWFAGQMLPDISTSLMILALALLCLAFDTLPRSSVISLAALIGGAVTFHQGNLLVGLWRHQLLVFARCWGGAGRGHSAAASWRGQPHLPSYGDPDSGKPCRRPFFAVKRRVGHAVCQDVGGWHGHRLARAGLSASAVRYLPDPWMSSNPTDPHPTRSPHRKKAFLRRTFSDTTPSTGWAGSATSCRRRG